MHLMVVTVNCRLLECKDVADVSWRDRNGIPRPLTASSELDGVRPPRRRVFARHDPENPQTLRSAIAPRKQPSACGPPHRLFRYGRSMATRLTPVITPTSHRLEVGQLTSFGRNDTSML